VPREFPRTRRVGEQIQRELSAVIREELTNPRLGLVTISGIEVSRDLAHARVYVTVLGDADQAAQTVDILRKAAGFLRHALGQRLAFRTVPELHFRYDDSVERGSRLDCLLEAALTPPSDGNKGNED
jgi:ribosome-binding factor A